jgi:hypothetical protein
VELQSSTLFRESAFALVVIGGCNPAENKEAKGSQTKKKADDQKADGAETWWCKEHGVPEHDWAQLATCSG